MKRIVFVGAPCSGKSVLATAVFTALKQAGRKAEHVDEFIRRDIQVNGPMMSIWEQYRTRQFQKELEDAVPETDYLICDSGTLSPYFYACLYADPNDARQRLVLQDMHKYLLDDLFLQRYDMVFYLPLLRTWHLNDGTRYQSEMEVREVDEHMRMVFTKVHHLNNVYSIDAGFDQRLDDVMWKILGNNLTSIRKTDIFNVSIQNY
jgi:nicotinamide riboside kinase